MQTIQSFLNFTHELNTPDGWSKLQAFLCWYYALMSVIWVFGLACKTSKVLNDMSFQRKQIKQVKDSMVFFFIFTVVIPFAVIAFLKTAPVDANSMTFLQKVLYYMNANTAEWWKGWQLLIVACIPLHLISGYGIFLLSLNGERPKFLWRFPFDVIWASDLPTFMFLSVTYDLLLYAFPLVASKILGFCAGVAVC